MPSNIQVRTCSFVCMANTGLLASKFKSIVVNFNLGSVITCHITRNSLACVVHLVLYSSPIWVRPRDIPGLTGIESNTADIAMTKEASCKYIKYNRKYLEFYLGSPILLKIKTLALMLKD